MNNKITAMAVAAALTAPMFAVEAAPKVYGRLQVEYASISNSSASVDDINGIVDNKMGRFGFKGSEDLGGGLKAIYAMEFGLETTENVSGANSFFDREKYVGLKIGKNHTIQAGALKSPYKYMGGVKYDTFVATTLQARDGSTNVRGGAASGDDLQGNSGGAMSGGVLGHGGFLENSISYIGKFKPVRVWLVTNLDESKGETAETAIGVDAKVGSFHFGIAGTSKDNCLATANNCTGGQGGSDSSKIFGSWSKAGHTIRAQVENVETDNSAGVNQGETDYIYLNYQFKMGKHLIDVAVGERDEDIVAGDDDEDWTRVAYAYNFSKKTRVFAGIAETDAVDASDPTKNDWDTFSIGMTVKF